MVKTDDLNTQDCSTPEMVKYSLGSCAESLVMNSFFGFSMLYYTKALGLGPEMAAIATFVAGFWDAITDPVMGHISDNTKSRFGKRYLYMVLGGILMIVSFFFIWYVPAFFKTELVIGSFSISSMAMIFAYLALMNLILRTAYTVFIVPFIALGFEICTDYDGRSKLQGIRFGLIMAVNLLGPAMAWFIFFPNNKPGQIQDTQIAQNYIDMGSIFTVCSFVFLLLMLFFMAKHIKSSRDDKNCQINFRAFFKDMKGIILDPYPRWAFIFMFFVQLGFVLVSALQMFVFDDFMKLNGLQKTIAHGGTMVGCAIGSFSLTFLVRRFDKKGAVYIAVSWAVFCELLLAALFLTGFLKPGQIIGGEFVPAGTLVDGVATTTDQIMGGFPVAFLVFAFLHAGFWFGNGVLTPAAYSMMADVSEIHRLKTGVNRDASYAAMLSLALKISASIGGLISGYCLLWAGFESGSEAVQTPQSIWNVCALTFIAGPLASLGALVLIIGYPVTKKYMEKMREETG